MEAPDDTKEPHDGGGLNEEEVRRRHILPKALVVGILAGLIASAFRMSLDHAEHFRESLLAGLPFWQGLLIAVGGGAAAGGLALWLVKRFAPEASGSGIPHLKSVLGGESRMDWKSLLPVKFIAGVLGIGGGLALGREGPTVQMGGAAGMITASLFRIHRGFGERKALISAGAGAGLAAAFNAPLAGVIFVLEELQGNFTPVVFVAAFLASVSGDVVSRLLVGDSPVFDLHDIPLMSVSELPLAFLLGILAGLAGAVFSRNLLSSLNLGERIGHPTWLPGALAGGITGLAGWWVPGMAGGGGTMAEHAITGNLALGAIPLLLIGRYVLTMVSYGSGAAGGFFAPMLVIGSLGGLMFGMTVESLAPDLLAHPQTFALLGMGALFTAVVRAPLTGIILMVELTGQYEFMLPLLVACLTAYGVVEWMRMPGIYESLRHRQSVKAVTARRG